MITPGQVRAALRDYVSLKAFLDGWFPAGASTAQITRATGVGRPVERFVLARADVQSVMDALTFCVSQLEPLDREIVQAYCFERLTAGDAARRAGVSRRWLFGRLDVAAAEIAVRLNAMDEKCWTAFLRFAEAVLEDQESDTLRAGGGRIEEHRL